MLLYDIEMKVPWLKEAQIYILPKSRSPFFRPWSICKIDQAVLRRLARVRARRTGTTRTLNS